MPLFSEYFPNCKYYDFLHLQNGTHFSVIAILNKSRNLDLKLCVIKANDSRLIKVCIVIKQYLTIQRQVTFMSP